MHYLPAGYAEPCSDKMWSSLLRKLLVRVTKWFHDVAWEREILSLHVKCKKSGRGCQWTGQIRHYQEHFAICQYEDVTCDKCYNTMYRGLFETHTTSQCPNRIVQCGYCEEDLEFWQKEIHYSDCKSFPCPCPQECGMQEIPREEVDSHVCHDCAMTVVPCPYKEAGCSFDDKRNILKAHLEASGEEHLRKTWSKLLETTKRLNQSETEMKSMKDQLEENEEEIRELQVEKMSIKERLADLEGQNYNLQTNTESVTKRLSEVDKTQQGVTETVRESMNLLDQKVTDIVSECRSSQKKCEEENIGLKEEVSNLKKQLEDVNSTNTSKVQQMSRYIQVIHSAVQAVKGKQPLNQPNPATRPLPVIPGPTSQPFRFPMRASAAGPSLPTSIQQRKPGKENTDKPCDSIKRRQAALGSGNAAVKKKRIEEAAKRKTDCVTRTANEQPKKTIPKSVSRPTERSGRSTIGSDSEEDSGEDSGEDAGEDSAEECSEDECQAVY